MNASRKSLRASCDISLRAESVTHNSALLRSLWHPLQ